jgi:hypothetical protein
MKLDYHDRPILLNSTPFCLPSSASEHAMRRAENVKSVANLCTYCSLSPILQRRPWIQLHDADSEKRKNRVSHGRHQEKQAPFSVEGGATPIGSLLQPEPPTKGVAKVCDLPILGDRLIGSDGCRRRIIRGLVAATGVSSLVLGLWKLDHLQV